MHLPLSVRASTSRGLHGLAKEPLEKPPYKRPVSYIYRLIYLTDFLCVRLRCQMRSMSHQNETRPCLSMYSTRHMNNLVVRVGQMDMGTWWVRSITKCRMHMYVHQKILPGFCPPLCLLWVQRLLKNIYQAISYMLYFLLEHGEILDLS